MSSYTAPSFRTYDMPEDGTATLADALSGRRPIEQGYDLPPEVMAAITQSMDLGGQPFVDPETQAIMNQSEEAQAGDVAPVDESDRVLDIGEGKSLGQALTTHDMDTKRGGVPLWMAEQLTRPRSNVNATQGFSIPAGSGLFDPVSIGRAAPVDLPMAWPTGEGLPSMTGAIGEIMAAQDAAALQAEQDALEESQNSGTIGKARKSNPLLDNLFNEATGQNDETKQLILEGYLKDQGFEGTGG